MVTLESLEFCSFCLNPVGFNALNPETDQVLQFQENQGQIFCEVCAELFMEKKFPPREFFDREFADFLSRRKRLLYAFSGGLDSTVVLALLAQKVREANIQLDVFTVETGVKGKIACQNIEKVISHLGLEANHFFYDISQKVCLDPEITALSGRPLTTMQVYKYCHDRQVLACGKICNRLIDTAYQEIMVAKGYDELITGGDTPKKSKAGQYSIFWQKTSGLTIVRGGYAFNLTKEKNRQLVADLGLPWVHPRCGGYDTDCLVPGVFFATQLGEQKEMSLAEVLSRFPIIFYYLTERVRFGVIERAVALKQLVEIDVASPDSIVELSGILSHLAE